VSEDHDPLKAFEVVEEELRAYRHPLTELPRLVAANKIDLPHERNLARCHRYFAGRGIPLYPVSALTKAGIPALKDGLQQSLRRAPGQRESGGAQRAL
ncbi:MAG: hypothetical protein ACREJ1_11950, partial [Candidatus Methylomirabilales bacterium]